MVKALNTVFISLFVFRDTVNAVLLWATGCVVGVRLKRSQDNDVEEATELGLPFVLCF